MRLLAGRLKDLLTFGGDGYGYGDGFGFGYGYGYGYTDWEAAGATAIER